MSLFAATRSALEVKLDTMSPKPTIVWENVAFKPTENSTFIQPFMLPSPASLADLNWLQDNRGIFQVDIYVPLEKGTGALNTIADTIGNLFKGTTLVSGSASVRIGAISYRHVGREESWYKGMIEINYQVYSS